MSDIHTIKNLLNFFPYIKEETWYMLVIGIVVYTIYIAYLIIFEQYYKTQNIILKSLEKKSIWEALNNLPIEDIHFFERLSFIIRSHLEDSEQVPLATKKTSWDIRQEQISHEWKEILDVCSYYEYTNERANNEQKMKIIERLRRSI
ncbi:MAG: hypothetical protein ACD_71C00044G0003 [uncultured bacterium (gcode 4)]|uniref:DUF4129 domain-containing protein n=1 Tax=uncultured bacterium (gcode 4) TaxID=1234023 RepID=K1Z663_9BACT|nr:MAG: hypothetical protein ACD_71C00044G0003 [uncultured bacterium (gcode 4)]